MFDKIYPQVKTVTEHVPYEKTVTINRAPTDKSVELLKEFEKEALDKIVKTYFIKTLTAEGIYFEMQNSPTSLGKSFVLIFNINGKQHTVRHNFEEWRFYHKEIEEPTPAKIFFRVVSDYIANEVLKSVIVKEI